MQYTRNKIKRNWRSGLLNADRCHQWGVVNLFKIWSYQVHNQVTSASHDILLWFLCSPFLSNQHFLRKIKPFTAEILVHQRTVDKTTNDQNWFLKARGNRGKPIVLQFAPHKQADTSQPMSMMRNQLLQASETLRLYSCGIGFRREQSSSAMT